MKFLLKHFFKIIPLFGTMLIFLGIIKLAIYYSFFGVQILTFLDLSECILLFLDGTILFTFFLIAGFFIGAHTGYSDLKNTQKEIRRNLTNEEEVQNKLSHSMQEKKRTTLVLGIIIGSTFILSGFSSFIWFPFSRAFHLALIFCIPGIIFLFSDKLLNYLPNLWKEATLPNVEVAELITFSILYLLLIINISASNAYIVKYQKHPKPFEAVTSTDRQLKTTDTLIYLGRTKGYLFLYDRKLNQCQIYSNSDIKSIKY